MASLVTVVFKIAWHFAASFISLALTPNSYSLDFHLKSEIFFLYFHGSVGLSRKPFCIDVSKFSSLREAILEMFKKNRFCALGYQNVWSKVFCVAAHFGSRNDSKAGVCNKFSSFSQQDVS